QTGELIAELLSSVAALTVHLRDDLSRGSFDAPVEARSEGFVGGDLDDLQVVDPEVHSPCPQVIGRSEAVGDEDELLVFVQLCGMRGQDLAEVVRPIRRHDRRYRGGERLPM